MERKVSDWGGTMSAFILVIFVNYLSNALPLNGFTQKDLSDKYTSLFTPAGFTFSIWGVIYLALAAFVVYQALPSQRNNVLMSKVSKLFIVSCFANMLWLFAWHYEFVGTSLVIMFGILATLIAIYRALGLNMRQATWKEHLFLHLPFSLYTGWITVATMANISIFQNAMGWDDLFVSATNWTLLKLAVVGVIGAIIVLRRCDFIYGLVIAWAAFGIMSKQVDTPMIAGAAMMLVAFSVILATYEGIRQLFKD
ncbi:tryptophan-rich sensory protein [Leucothrix arctica]|uniref:Tryptophan-rich sensory protein n=1 Tax=Leucothrix arctica TaxID=1481894 RepID=A0A317CCW7_9GAMM|nr:tryptophan-rich sensory protein [Leucothrix arctica]PWQ96525.1 tryptophan-rich sensory protein [Leucothrix arctica]